MKGFLCYHEGNSIFHRLNPLTKVFISILLCASCFITSNIFLVMGIIVLNMVIAAVSGILMLGLKTLKGLLKLSIILFIVQVLFMGDGNLLFTIPLVNINITEEGVMFSLLLVLRLMAAALPLAILLSVTQLTDLTNAMVAKLKIPYKYAYSLITAIRFIPVFSAEMAGIIEAQTARGVEFDTKNPFKKLKLLVPLCVPLLISSVKKIDLGATSAELRGFNLRKKNSGYKKFKFHVRDLGIVFLSGCVFATGFFI